MNSNPESPPHEQQQRRGSSFRFSLLSIFEFTTAVIIVLVGFGIGMREEDTPSLIEFGSVYGIKLLLSNFLRQWKFISGGLYAVMLIVVGGLSAFREGVDFSEPLTFAFLMFLWLAQWYIVPSLSLAYDLNTTTRPSLRTQIWRTTIEIVLLVPLVRYFAFLAIAILLILFGVPGI